MDPKTIRRLAAMMSAQQEGDASMTGSGLPSSLLFDRARIEDSMSRSTQAAKEKGPPLVYSTALKPTSFIRYEFIAGYNQTIKFQEHERNIKSTPISMRQTMKPLIEHGVAPTLNTLTTISLRQVARLGVNKIHADRVLFCTTSYAAYRTVATQVLVEDDGMDCLLLSLYNYVQEYEDPNQVLPVGTHLAVLAPYMKNALDDRQKNLMLRCDNPQCIIKYDSKAAWLAAREGRPAPPETSDALSLKERGNKSFRNNDFNAAERFYSRALQSSPIQESDKIACWSNRAEVALRSGQWEYAERDAREVLAIDGDHVKAKFRLAKAQYRLGRPSEALEVVQELLGKIPKDRSFQELYNDCEKTIQEQQGHYDLPAMRKAARSYSCSKKLQFHDDYVSPDIEIGVDIEAAGGDEYRGCRAVRDIEDKEILSSSQAVVFAPASKQVSTTMQLDVYSSRMDQSSQNRLVSEVIALLQRRPKVGKALYNLSAGLDSDTVPLAETEMIDIPRIRRILSSNTFALFDDGADVTIHWEMRKEECKKGRSLTGDETRCLHDKNLFGSGSGLWLRESMFNHSCTPNCEWSQIGDQMFIRCTRPILAGEELSIS
jgi:tetratricopeptide (TPR) repeat protein